VANSQLCGPLRSRRRVLNYPKVEALLHRMGIKYVDVVTTSADNSTMEQLALFNSAGLVLSSHSSQLVNMIVMRHGSQLVRTRGSPDAALKQ